MNKGCIKKSFVAIAGLLLLTLSAVAKDVDFTYTTNLDNTITITGYTGSGGSVDIKNTIDGRLVTIIGESAFEACSNITSITIGTNVTTIGYHAFYGCDGLTSVTIPASVTDIGFYVFEECSYLTEITVDAGNSFYSSLDGVLFNHSRTTLIKCPENSAISSYTITNSVTVIEDSSFFACTNLTGVMIPGSVTEIRDYAFDWCLGLTSITIPDSVTTLGLQSFYVCPSLTNAIIGNSVSYIGEKAFYNCTSLAGVYFRGNAPTFGNDVFIGATNIIYRAADATGWPTVPDAWAGRATAFWDSDGDGISDPWEERYFGGPTNANPTAICSNGYNTVFDAYIAGLDPKDPQSTLRVSVLCPPSSEKVLSWNSVSGRVYSVYFSSNLMNGFPPQPLAPDIPWPQTGYTNTTASPRGFYQIKVRLP